MADPFPVLRKIHLFAALTNDELQKLAQNFEAAPPIPADEYVFHQGDVGDAFYVIQSGKVDVIVTNVITGQERKLATLVERDYFGERTLLKGGTRSASVKAVTELKLWRLGRENFRRFILRNPKIKPHMDVALQSRNYARSANFQWLRDDEVVYLVTLQHRLFLWKMLALPSVVMLVILLIGAAMLFFKLPASWLPGPLLFALLDLAWLRWNWIDFHNDWYVVTNQRVVDIDKIALLYDSRAEAPIQSVTTTALKKDEWGNALGYGDVIVNTFSGPIAFHNVPNPQATADMILEQVNRAKEKQYVQDKESLKNTIRQSLGLGQLPPQPKPAETHLKPARRGVLGGLIKQLDIHVREQNGDTLIYHKHPYILALTAGTPAAGVLAVLFVVFLRLFNVFALDWLIVLPLAFLFALFFAVVAIYQYVDWKNDIYLVTPTQIFDIERKPFGAEQRKGANLDAVQNVALVRPSFIATLLNYGTVTVQAGPGGEMKFFDVFDPLGVQQDIYRRREILNANKAIAAARQRHEEIGQYLEAFYEIMEEERKKREGKNLT